MANQLWDEHRRRLAALLKDGRIAVGVSQVQMAEKLGKPQSYVSKYESGERKLDFVEVIEVCHALDVDPHRSMADYLQCE
jgi:transcriptional regulator with XRE-family HTH domain